MTAGRRVLVVGADGSIGAAVATRLEAAGIVVVRTSRRGTAGSEPLDLTAAAATWRLPPDLSAAVLCAAVTSTEACRNHPDEARRVNVEATVELGRRLAAAGSRLVFLSTNMVFDGSVPHVAAAAARRPRTAYGRMKAEAEEALLAIDGATTVVRLTKVVTGSLPILVGWRDALRRGEAIRPLSDLVMAPVSLNLAATVILQVSARADVSYADVARRLADRWGFPADRVAPATAAEAGVRLEHLPAHTTLDASIVRDRLGIESPDPWAAIEEAA